MSVPAVIPNVRNVRLTGRAAPLREPLRSMTFSSSRTLPGQW